MQSDESNYFVPVLVTLYPPSFSPEVLCRVYFVVVSVVNDGIECGICHDEGRAVATKSSPAINLCCFGFPPVEQSILQVIVVFFFGVRGDP